MPPVGAPASISGLTILALSREWRENHVAQNPNPDAPLVGLQRRVMRRCCHASLVYEYDRPYRHPIAAFDVERHANEEQLLLSEKFIDI